MGNSGKETKASVAVDFSTALAINSRTGQTKMGFLPSQSKNTDDNIRRNQIKTLKDDKGESETKAFNLHARAKANKFASKFAQSVNQRKLTIYDLFNTNSDRPNPQIKNLLWPVYNDTLINQERIIPAISKNIDYILTGNSELLKEKPYIPPLLILLASMELMELYRISIESGVINSGSTIPALGREVKPAELIKCLDRCFDLISQHYSTPKHKRQGPNISADVLRTIAPGINLQADQLGESDAALLLAEHWSTQQCIQDSDTERLTIPAQEALIQNCAHFNKYQEHFNKKSQDERGKKTFANGSCLVLSASIASHVADQSIKRMGNRNSEANALKDKLKSTKAGSADNNTAPGLAYSIINSLDVSSSFDCPLISLLDDESYSLDPFSQLSPSKSLMRAYKNKDRHPSFYDAELSKESECLKKNFSEKLDLEIKNILKVYSDTPQTSKNTLEIKNNLEFIASILSLRLIKMLSVYESIEAPTDPTDDNYKQYAEIGNKISKYTIALDLIYKKKTFITQEREITVEDFLNLKGVTRSKINCPNGMAQKMLLSDVAINYLNNNNPEKKKLYAIGAACNTIGIPPSTNYKESCAKIFSYFSRLKLSVNFRAQSLYNDFVLRKKAKESKESEGTPTNTPREQFTTPNLFKIFISEVAKATDMEQEQEQEQEQDEESQQELQADLALSNQIDTVNAVDTVDNLNCNIYSQEDLDRSLGVTKRFLELSGYIGMGAAIQKAEQLMDIYNVFFTKEIKRIASKTAKDPKEIEGIILDQLVELMRENLDKAAVFINDWVSGKCFVESPEHRHINVYKISPCALPAIFSIHTMFDLEAKPNPISITINNQKATTSKGSITGGLDIKVQINCPNEFSKATISPEGLPKTLKVVLKKEFAGAPPFLAIKANEDNLKEKITKSSDAVSNFVRDISQSRSKEERQLIFSKLLTIKILNSPMEHLEDYASNKQYDYILSVECYDEKDKFLSKSSDEVDLLNRINFLIQNDRNDGIDAKTLFLDTLHNMESISSGRLNDTGTTSTPIVSAFNDSSLLHEKDDIINYAIDNINDHRYRILDSLVRCISENKNVDNVDNAQDCKNIFSYFNNKMSTFGLLGSNVIGNIANVISEAYTEIEKNTLEQDIKYTNLSQLIDLLNSSKDVDIKDYKYVFGNTDANSTKEYVEFPLFWLLVASIQHSMSNLDTFFKNINDINIHVANIIDTANEALDANDPDKQSKAENRMRWIYTLLCNELLSSKTNGCFDFKKSMDTFRSFEDTVLGGEPLPQFTSADKSTYKTQDGKKSYNFDSEKTITFKKLQEISNVLVSTDQKSLQEQKELISNIPHDTAAVVQAMSDRSHAAGAIPLRVVTDRMMLGDVGSLFYIQYDSMLNKSRDVAKKILHNFFDTEDYIMAKTSNHAIIGITRSELQDCCNFIRQGTTNDRTIAQNKETVINNLSSMIMEELYSTLFLQETKGSLPLTNDPDSVFRKKIRTGILSGDFQDILVRRSNRSMEELSPCIAMVDLDRGDANQTKEMLVNSLNLSYKASINHNNNPVFSNRKCELVKFSDAISTKSASIDMSRYPLRLMLDSQLARCLRASAANHTEQRLRLTYYCEAFDNVTKDISEKFDNLSKNFAHTELALISTLTKDDSITKYIPQLENNSNKLQSLQILPNDDLLYLLLPTSITSHIPFGSGKIESISLRHKFEKELSYLVSLQILNGTYNAEQTNKFIDRHMASTGQQYIELCHTLVNVSMGTLSDLSESIGNNAINPSQKLMAQSLLKGSVKKGADVLKAILSDNNLELKNYMLRKLICICNDITPQEINNNPLLQNFYQALQTNNVANIIKSIDDAMDDLKKVSEGTPINCNAVDPFDPQDRNNAKKLLIKSSTTLGFLGGLLGCIPDRGLISAGARGANADSNNIKNDNDVCIISLPTSPEKAFLTNDQVNAFYQELNSLIEHEHDNFLEQNCIPSVVHCLNTTAANSIDKEVELTPEQKKSSKDDNETEKLLKQNRGYRNDRNNTIGESLKNCMNSIKGHIKNPGNDINAKKTLIQNETDALQNEVNSCIQFNDIKAAAKKSFENKLAANLVKNREKFNVDAGGLTACANIVDLQKLSQPLSSEQMKTLEECTALLTKLRTKRNELITLTPASSDSISAILKTALQAKEKEIDETQKALVKKEKEFVDKITTLSIHEDISEEFSGYHDTISDILYQNTHFDVSPIDKAIDEVAKLNPKDINALAQKAKDVAKLFQDIVLKRKGKIISDHCADTLQANYMLKLSNAIGRIILDYTKDDIAIAVRGMKKIFADDKTLKDGATNCESAFVQTLAMSIAGQDILYNTCGEISPRNEQKLSVIQSIMNKNIMLEQATGEGKTLIDGLVGVMNSWMGNKVTILTRSKILCTELKTYLTTHFPNCDVTIMTALDKPDGTVGNNVVNTDILIADYAGDTINFIKGERVTFNEARDTRNTRRNDMVILDEADGIKDDIMNVCQVSSSMYVSNNSDKYLYICVMEFIQEMIQNPDKFLENPSEIKSETLKKLESFLTDKASKINTNKSIISSSYGLEDLDEDYFKNLIKNRFKDTDYAMQLLKAGFTACNLKFDIDYILSVYSEKEEDVMKLFDEKTSVVGSDTGTEKKLLKVVIVDKDSSGEQNPQSKWSKEVHQCVAAKEAIIRLHDLNILRATNDTDKNDKIDPEYRAKVEKRKDVLHLTIDIPNNSSVIAATSVDEHVRRYDSKIGLSGTMGIGVERDKIANITANPTMKSMPRSTNNLLVIDEPVEIENMSDFKAEIARAILDAQENTTNSSLLISVKSIESANFVKDFIEHNKLVKQTVIKQVPNPLIFDDQNDKEKKDGSFRPQKNVVKNKASDPGRITIATSVGSRGIDYRSLGNVLVIEEMGQRNTRQALGRSGRGGKKGFARVMVYKKPLEIMEADYTKSLKQFSQEAEKRFPIKDKDEKERITIQLARRQEYVDNEKRQLLQIDEESLKMDLLKKISSKMKNRKQLEKELKGLDRELNNISTKSTNPTIIALLKKLTDRKNDIQLEIEEIVLSVEKTKETFTFKFPNEKIPTADELINSPKYKENMKVSVKRAVYQDSFAFLELKRHTLKGVMNGVREILQKERKARMDDMIQTMVKSDTDLDTSIAGVSIQTEILSLYNKVKNLLKLNPNLHCQSIIIDTIEVLFDKIATSLEDGSDTPKAIERLKALISLIEKASSKEPQDAIKLTSLSNNGISETKLAECLKGYKESKNLSILTPTEKELDVFKKTTEYNKLLTDFKNKNPDTEPDVVKLYMEHHTREFTSTATSLILTLLRSQYNSKIEVYNNLDLFTRKPHPLVCLVNEKNNPEEECHTSSNGKPKNYVPSITQNVLTGKEQGKNYSTNFVRDHNIPNISFYMYLLLLGKRNGEAYLTADYIMNGLSPANNIIGERTTHAQIEQSFSKLSQNISSKDLKDTTNKQTEIIAEDGKGGLYNPDNKKFFEILEESPTLFHALTFEEMITRKMTKPDLEAITIYRLSVEGIILSNILKSKYGSRVRDIMDEGVNKLKTINRNHACLQQVMNGNDDINNVERDSLITQHVSDNIDANITRGSEQYDTFSVNKNNLYTANKLLTYIDAVIGQMQNDNTESSYGMTFSKNDIKQEFKNRRDALQFAIDAVKNSTQNVVHVTLANTGVLTNAINPLNEFMVLNSTLSTFLVQINKELKFPESIYSTYHFIGHTDDDITELRKEIQTIENSKINNTLEDGPLKRRHTLLIKKLTRVTKLNDSLKVLKQNIDEYLDNLNDTNNKLQDNFNNDTSVKIKNVISDMCDFVLGGVSDNLGIKPEDDLNTIKNRDWAKKAIDNAPDNAFEENLSLLLYHVQKLDSIKKDMDTIDINTVDTEEKQKALLDSLQNLMMVVHSSCYQASSTSLSISTKCLMGIGKYTKELTDDNNYYNDSPVIIDLSDNNENRLFHEEEVKYLFAKHSERDADIKQHNKMRDSIQKTKNDARIKNQIHKLQSSHIRSIDFLVQRRNQIIDTFHKNYFTPLKTAKKEHEDRCNDLDRMNRDLEITKLDIQSDNNEITELQKESDLANQQITLFNTEIVNKQTAMNNIIGTDPDSVTQRQAIQHDIDALNNKNTQNRNVIANSNTRINLLRNQIQNKTQNSTTIENINIPNANLLLDRAKRQLDHAQGEFDHNLIQEKREVNNINETIIELQNNLATITSNLAFAESPTHSNSINNNDASVLRNESNVSADKLFFNTKSELPEIKKDIKAGTKNLYNKIGFLMSCKISAKYGEIMYKSHMMSVQEDELKKGEAHYQTLIANEVNKTIENVSKTTAGMKAITQTEIDRFIHLSLKEEVCKQVKSMNGVSGITKQGVDALGDDVVNRIKNLYSSVIADNKENREKISASANQLINTLQRTNEFEEKMELTAAENTELTDLRNAIENREQLIRDCIKGIIKKIQGRVLISNNHCSHEQCEKFIDDGDKDKVADAIIEELDLDQDIVLNKDEVESAIYAIAYLNYINQLDNSNGIDNNLSKRCVDNGFTLLFPDIQKELTINSQKSTVESNLKIQKEDYEDSINLLQQHFKLKAADEVICESTISQIQTKQNVVPNQINRHDRPDFMKNLAKLTLNSQWAQIFEKTSKLDSITDKEELIKESVRLWKDEFLASSGMKPTDDEIKAFEEKVAKEFDQGNRISKEIAMVRIHELAQSAEIPPPSTKEEAQNIESIKKSMESRKTFVKNTGNLNKEFREKCIEALDYQERFIIAAILLSGNKPEYYEELISQEMSDLSSRIDQLKVKYNVKEFDTKDIINPDIHHCAKTVKPEDTGKRLQRIHTESLLDSPHLKMEVDKLSKKLDEASRVGVLGKAIISGAAAAGFLSTIPMMVVPPVVLGVTSLSIPFIALGSVFSVAALTIGLLGTGMIIYKKYQAKDRITEASIVLKDGFDITVSRKGEKGEIETVISDTIKPDEGKAFVYNVKIKDGQIIDVEKNVKQEDLDDIKKTAENDNNITEKLDSNTGIRTRTYKSCAEQFRQEENNTHIPPEQGVGAC